jgi:hypothetical protein
VDWTDGEGVGAAAALRFGAIVDAGKWKLEEIEKESKGCGDKGVCEVAT